jgi:hypothetical protein
MRVALNASSYTLDEGSRQEYPFCQNSTFPSKVSFKIVWTRSEKFQPRPSMPCRRATPELALPPFLESLMKM